MAKKRIFSVILALSVALSLLPAAASPEGEESAAPGAAQDILSPEEQSSIHSVEEDIEAVGQAAGNAALEQAVAEADAAVGTEDKPGADAAADVITETITEVNREIDSLSRELTAAIDQTLKGSAPQTDIDRYIRQAQEQYGQAARLEQIASDPGASLADRQGAADQAQEAAVQAREAADRMTDAVRQNRGAVDAAQARLNEARARYDELVAAARETVAGADAGTRQAELDEALKALNEAKGTLDTARTQYDAVKTVLEGVKDVAATAEAAAELARQAAGVLESADSGLNEASSRLEAATSRLEEARAAVSTAEDDLRSARGALEAEALKVQAAREEIQRLQREEDATHIQLSSARQRLAAAQAAQTRAREAVAAAESRLAETRAPIQELSEQQSAAQANYDAAAAGKADASIVGALGEHVTDEELRAQVDSAVALKGAQDTAQGEAEAAQRAFDEADAVLNGRDGGKGVKQRYEDAEAAASAAEAAYDNAKEEAENFNQETLKKGLDAAEKALTKLDGSAALRDAEIDEEVTRQNYFPSEQEAQNWLKETGVFWGSIKDKVSYTKKDVLTKKDQLIEMYPSQRPKIEEAYLRLTDPDYTELDYHGYPYPAADKKAEYGKAYVELIAAQRRVEQLKEENAEAIVEKNTEIAGLKNDIANFDAKKQELDNELARLTSELQDKDGAREAAKVELDAARERFDAAGRDLENAQGGLTAARAAYGRALDAVNTRIRALAAEGAQGTEDPRALQELLELKGRLAAARQALAAAEGGVEEAQGVLDRARAGLTSAAGEAAAASGDITAAQERIEAAAARLEEARRARDELDRLMEGLRENCLRANAALESAKSASQETAALQKAEDEARQAAALARENADAQWRAAQALVTAAEASRAYEDAWSALQAARVRVEAAQAKLTAARGMTCSTLAEQRALEEAKASLTAAETAAARAAQEAQEARLAADAAQTAADQAKRDYESYVANTASSSSWNSSHSGGSVEAADEAVPLAAGPVTCAQLIDYLWRYGGRPEARDFPDAAAESGFTSAIRWARSTGLIAGDSDDFFTPDGLITVSAMRGILTRYAALLNSEMPWLASLSGEADDPVFNCADVLSEFFDKINANMKDNSVAVKGVSRWNSLSLPVIGLLPLTW